jgi:hypothetical protein
MRTKQVTINGKTINVNEKKVIELKILFTQFSGEADTLMKANNAADLGNAVNDLLGPKLTLISPELTAEDIDNAYPSELEELAGAFVDVNFTGIKKVATPLLGLISKGLQAK